MCARYQMRRRGPFPFPRRLGRRSDRLILDVLILIPPRTSNGRGPDNDLIASRHQTREVACLDRTRGRGKTAQKQEKGIPRQDKDKTGGCRHLRRVTDPRGGERSNGQADRQHRDVVTRSPVMSPFPARFRFSLLFLVSGSVLCSCANVCVNQTEMSYYTCLGITGHRRVTCPASIILTQT